MSDDDLKQWKKAVPRSSSDPMFKAVRPTVATPTPEELAQQLAEEKEIERQRVKAWNRMGDLMLKVVASIRRNEREQRRTRIVVGVAAGIVLMVVVWALIVVVKLVQANHEHIRDVHVVALRSDENSARTLKVVLKQAAAHAKSVEAEVALTPRADEEAMVAAVELLEEAAEARLDVAAKRREPPPEEAKRELETARKKKQAIADAMAEESKPKR